METEQNHFYQICFRVRRGTKECPMPSHFTGAYVTCYASASNHLDAVKRVYLQLRREGFLVDRVEGKVIELDPLKWQVYIEVTWEGMLDRLPTQEELPEKIAAGAVFYGPFIAFEE